MTFTLRNLDGLDSPLFDVVPYQIVFVGGKGWVIEVYQCRKPKAVAA